MCSASGPWCEDVPGLCALWDGASCKSVHPFPSKEDFGRSECWYVLNAWPGPPVWDVGSKLWAKWCFLQLPLGSSRIWIYILLALVASDFFQIIVDASSHTLSANFTSKHVHVELSRHPQCSCEFRQLWRCVGYHRQNGALLAVHSCLLLSPSVLSPLDRFTW